MCLAVYLTEMHCSGAECGVAVCNVLELSVVQVAAYLGVVHCTRGEREVTVYLRVVHCTGGELDVTVYLRVVHCTGAEGGVGGAGGPETSLGAVLGAEAVAAAG
jgi:hypothetical protein